VLRQFTDTLGVTWRVWDVHPVVTTHAMSAPAQNGLFRVPEGWLCFESESGRRRLAPIPIDWATTDLLNLEYYCSRAENVELGLKFPGDSAC